ncbi:Butyryl-CoA dehydrogenase [Sphingobium chlorophenolicum L-1]|uniref:Butyryl-CoA dehydrogenase n=1 Tax=Sphingobium chlorophenolicum L-1 TaxID=690566 RepID=F6EWB0_SPHCR|nr:acyl-CoA dehydrogenase family protein [Sphingobium chlorophenolicum]AEG49804.1 Butyryl-CoA dehydrogenase [Sphingobium chlorophenolicum L-1]
MGDMNEGSVTGYMTEERIQIRDMARDFVRKDLLPLANKLDPIRGDMPRELIEQMGDLGFFGIVIPEELGGLGLGAFEFCLVAEELARGWMSASSIIARGNAGYLTVPGSGEARKEKIRLMAQGRYLGASALSEPGTGSDLSGITCQARRDGDHWVITGNKYWCTYADGANFIRVLCRLEGEDEPSGKAKTAIIPVEKPAGQLPEGVTGNPIPKIGYYGWKTWELRFEDVRVPIQSTDEAPLGYGGGGVNAAAQSLSLARAHTAARSIGLARGALEDAIAYAKDRVQFGQPISDFQAIRFKIATMATEVEAARQLLHYVCAEIDAGRAERVHTSMVKYFAAEMAERVTSEALQIHGGSGYTTLHAVERHWRDARLTKIFEGTSEIQQRIIADSLLGKPTIRGSN